jgi:bifunctional UDP-N-acetylglucosamine pyrophosphorylase/glucosamine-1-phosphate N-acetyltransferase
MTSPGLAAVVMAGGLGTRMRSELPKHFHPLLGRRIVDWVLVTADQLAPDRLVVVASPQGAAEFEGRTIAVQEKPLGTGDALRAARAELDGFAGEVLVLSGDTPLLTAELLGDLMQHHRESGAAATILSARPDDPRLYGRVVRGADGRVERIAEGTDASEEELAIAEINTSIYVFESGALWPAIDKLEPHNVQGELYLTDTVQHLVEAGETVSAYVAPDARETDGVNTRAELASAAATLRDRINHAHMLAGVTIVDPATAWIDPAVELEADTTVHPFVVLRGATRVRAGAVINAHTVAIDAEIGPGADVGPFCYVRPGTVLGERAKVGTFVEIKNSRVGRESKIPHLSYIGDADVGSATNIAAGNITANFPHKPGEAKGRTTVGSNVRTGIQNGFVAPVTVGDGAWIAAGSVVTKDVPPGALAFARARQVNKENYVHGDGSVDRAGND